MKVQQQPVLAPLTVFYSYAHEDEALRDKLEDHLRSLQAQGLISEWYDRQIVAGSEWAYAIDSHLQTASIILLLISPDFMASDYCISIEMQQAMERHRLGDARVIPIILKPTAWHDAPFAILQCLPSNARPVTTWNDPEDAFEDIAQGLHRAIEEMNLLYTGGPHHPSVPMLLAPADGQWRKVSNHLPSPIDSQSRQRMLERVRARWITGLLKDSLNEAALITLGLYERSDAVANPWSFSLQEMNQPARPLRLGTRIIQAYDYAQGELLILGEPGCGKTTLLLELTRDLIERAKRDETHPIPVVFTLSSWTLKQQPIASWLVEELILKYQVPRSLAQRWVKTDQILPLLDGLDEVAPNQRAACIEALNGYRSTHGLLPTVICSRSAEYLSQKTRVLLRTAVVVQPLTPEQIEVYLKSAKQQLASVREALRTDGVLQEMVATPLMLSIVALAYQGTSIEDLLILRSPEARRQRVFATYIERMLQRRGTETRYSSQQIMKWLIWLAGQMVRRSQTEFYIERMQPDWLPGRWSYWLYLALAVWPTSAFIGLLTGIIIGGLPISHTGAISGGLVGLIVGMLTSIKIGDTLSGTIVAARWSKLIKIIPTFSGAILGLVLVIPNEIAHHIFNSIHILPIFLHNASIGLLVGVLVSIKGVNVQTFEIMVWSWHKFTKFTNIRNGLFVGLITVLIDLMVSLPALMTSLSVGLTAFFSSSRLIFLVSGTLVGWLISGLVDTLSSNVLDDSNRITPNQGIHSSARNSIQIGLIIGLTSGLLIGLVLILTYWQLYGLAWLVRGVSYLAFYMASYGPTVAVGTSIISGLLRGGDACIKHVVLRLELRATKRIPWHYPRFLDYAAERILLHKVGGGYRFTHRLLLEYFATLDAKQ
jgi:eukaryotic-like serine/threonine-protein kinase